MKAPLTPASLLLYTYIFLFALPAAAQGTFNSNSTAGNWNLASSWTLISGTDADGIPDADDQVIILNTHQIRVNVNSAAASVTINSGGTLNFNTNSVTCAVGGNFTFNGTGTVTGTGATRILTIGGNLSVATGAASAIPGIDVTVTGNSSILGSLDFSGTTGNKVLTGNVTVGPAGILGSSAGEAIDCNANLTLQAGSTIHGTGTIIMSVLGNLTVQAGGTSSFGRSDITINGSSTINGTLSFITSTAGNKTLTGPVTFNNGSALYYGVSETLDVLDNAVFNGSVSVSGATTGIMNVSGSYTVSAGATVNLGDQTLTVLGNTLVNGSLIINNNQGGKTFTGLVTVNGTWDCSTTDESFVMNGGLTNAGIFLASQTMAAASNYTFAASASLAGTISMPNMTVTGAATNLLNTGVLTVTTSLSGSGTLTQGPGTFLFIGAPSVTATLVAAANGNTVDFYDAGNQNIPGINYYHLVASGGGTKTLSNNITVDGNLTIQNTSSLDAGTNRTISLLGNWNVTSTSADPFVEQQGKVSFTGTSGTQNISTPLAAGETFYDLVMNNSSVTNPGIFTTAHINIAHAYTHTLGLLNLNGRTLTITGYTGATTDNFTGGSIISGVSGANILITDPNNNKRVNFYGTAIGTSSQGITVNCTSNDSYFTNTILYGTANFTKTGAGMNDTQGGNIFYGPVTFTTAVGADRWRMANTNPDIFYNATFIHNGTSNFIVARQTLGNEFYGTTTFTSTTSGGMYISRANTAAPASATFHGPVVFNITLGGNITISEGGGQTNTSVFESTITLNSTGTSTGDYIFGGPNNNNNITLTSSGAFVAGSINGQTNVRLYNVTQTGSTPQVLNTTGSTGTLYIGGVTSLTSAYPCSFMGNCSFSADTSGYISSGSFAGNLNFNVTNGNGYLQTCNVGGNLVMSAATLRIRNSNINGTTGLTQTGSIASTTNGGNVFSGNATVTSTGSGQLRMASSGGDNYKANATFVQTGTGALMPVYSAPCIFEGNISTLGSTSVITFGSSATGTTITTGTGTQIIDGPAAFIPVFNYLQTNHTGVVQLNKSITVALNLTMSQGRINLNSNILTLGTGSAAGTAGTLAWTSGWMYNGTFRRWQYSTSYALTNQRGLFPMGSAVGDFRPLWLAYTSNLTAGGTFSVTHSPVYPSTYITAGHNDASWGNIVQGVSNSSWTIATASGFAFNGSTGQIRFGGTGFGIFSLSDLDASLTSSVVGTFSAATNTNVPLEVTRTALTTATVNNLWRIGTRNLVNSPLPVTLIDFTAQPQGHSVALTWKTASELNNDYFTVEKSADGIVFSEVTQMVGTGTSNAMHSYSFNDDLPYSGISYYRLKQTDYNGLYTYSEIRTVTLKPEPVLVLFPNPAHGSFQVRLPDIQSDYAVLSVSDLSGKTVHSENLSIQKNNPVLKVDHLLLPAGIYIVSVRTDTASYTGTLLAE